MNLPTKKTPEYWDDAIRVLSNQDLALVGLFQAYRGETLSGGGDAFKTLANAIVGQQISVKAAESIWQRLLNRLGSISPESILAIDGELLRQEGLSKRKVEYIVDLSKHFVEGKINPLHFHEMTDEEVIKALTDVRGIGRWTAEMFLIFHLLRQDVLPLDDIGLQRAVAKHYGWEYPFAVSKLAVFAERWAPYRTVATWFMWRSLDPIPVAY
ncbi:DNA-3-methyladenine glycosylase 2 family protein [Leeia sp. TBRC 13508]|uniref:DNA-3-methyladenine glycosylase II n=1 Tax=Leeia speluncae TaxID=2884804 RepID=A0ABS8D861_9NEIS|nr:DNA-3-methyladenine glycosylase 2 family protein [Leeia speluncae]MCB6184400.1 DNA-3-methyladenine glycosylase 2 family protein [Leeia speluncae]